MPLDILFLIFFKALLEGESQVIAESQKEPLCVPLYKVQGSEDDTF